MSCRSILKKLLFQGAITQKEFDKIERNLKTEAETQDGNETHCCNNCRHYLWYYDSCTKWQCEVDCREVHPCFVKREEQA